MKIGVDPSKLEELSAELKSLARTIENGEEGIYPTLTRLIGDTQSDYTESYDVQNTIREMEGYLKEIHSLAESIAVDLGEKANFLTEAAELYRGDETKLKNIAQVKVPPSSFYTPGGGLAGEGLTTYLQDKLFEDPAVQKLHLQAQTGTEEEQLEAKEKLDAIFKARDTIARAQVAYSVYKSFGNVYLMGNAHKEAVKQREILKGYGVSEDLYGEKVNLSHLYSGSTLQACSYDPSFQLTKDGKFVQVPMPDDNQYHYLLGLVMKGGSQGAWAHKQLEEIHKLLSEIGRAQVAWSEYKAKGMQKEMDGAHAYAEKVRTQLKEKYSLSSEMVDDVDYKHLWTRTGVAGNHLKTQDTNAGMEQSLDLVSIAQQVVFGNEGDYGTVVKDDGKNPKTGYPGGVSIGKLQWHEGRAYDLVLKIMKVDMDTAKKILGENSKIYKELSDSSLAKKVDRWKARVLTDEEAKAISKLISTDIGKRAQDELARLDMQSYLNVGKKQGITDEKALIYFADLYNQSPKGALRIVNAIKASGETVTLASIHKASLSDETMGKYVTRRELTYTKCSQLALISKPEVNEVKPQDKTLNGNLDVEGINKFLSIAEQELAKGFKEYVPKGKNEGDNNTPYGKWYGLNYQPWCAMFVSYCADQAGLMGTVIPKFASVEEGRKWYVKNERFEKSSSDYIPKAGDVIFFRKGNQNHTGIITGYDSKTKTIYTIEGNTSDKVARRSYNLNNKNYIVGYGVNGGTEAGTLPNDATSGENNTTR